MTTPTDATGRPASLCMSYSKGICTLPTEGSCRARDKRDKTRCTSGGKATWCGLALRGRTDR